MTNNSWVTVDASLLAKLRFPEPLSDITEALYRAWTRDQIAVHAPLLVLHELVSTANKKILAGETTLEEAQVSLDFFLSEPLELVASAVVHRQALELAQQFGLRSTYDAHYLAVSQELDCEFWTADERLYKAVSDGFPLIRWIGAA